MVVFHFSPFACAGQSEPVLLHIQLHAQNAQIMSGEAARSFKTACRACRQRKVRCDKKQPCIRCAEKSIPCVFQNFVRKPSKRRKRHIVIKELRNDDVSSPETTKPIDDILTTSCIAKCIETFLREMSQTVIMLDRGQLQKIVDNLQQETVEYVFILSLCAAFSYDSPKFAKQLCDEALCCRVHLPNTEGANLYILLTCYFISFFYGRNGLLHNSWFYMREAVSLLQLQRLDREYTYSFMDGLQASRLRCMFWLLFVSERAMGIQNKLSVLLGPTVSLPTELDVSEELRASFPGFINLIHVFYNVDADFLSLWNGEKQPSGASIMLALQRKLDTAIVGHEIISDVQWVDILISKQWLRICVWQLCVQHGLLSSDAKDKSLQFTFPLTVAKEMITLTRSIQKSAFEPHNANLASKIFDVACTVGDIYRLAPQNPSTFNMEEIKATVSEFFHMFASLRYAERYLPLLVEIINESLLVGIPTTPNIINSNGVASNESSLHALPTSFAPLKQTETFNLHSAALTESSPPSHKLGSNAIPISTIVSQF